MNKPWINECIGKGRAGRLSTLFIQAGNDDIRIVEKLVTSHEIQYKSISFGEDVIKEMIMSSVFGIPVSAKVIIDSICINSF